MSGFSNAERYFDALRESNTLRLTHPIIGVTPRKTYQSVSILYKLAFLFGFLSAAAAIATTLSLGLNGNFNLISDMTNVSVKQIIAIGADPATVLFSVNIISAAFVLLGVISALSYEIVGFVTSLIFIVISIIVYILVVAVPIYTPIQAVIAAITKNMNTITRKSDAIMDLIVIISVGINLASQFVAFICISIGYGTLVSARKKFLKRATLRANTTFGDNYANVYDGVQASKD